MRKIYIIVLLVVLFGPYANSQSISKVQANVQENHIMIRYFVSGLKFNEWLIVSLYVSRVEENSFRGPLKEVWGDVGDSIRGGWHTLHWQSLKEIPFEDADLVFDVRGELYIDRIERKYFLSYVANTITPFGMRLGQTGKLGWYIEARSSLNPLAESSYTFENDKIIDFDNPGYYQFTDYNNYSSYAIIGGITYQLNRSLFITTGLGYAKEDYLFQVDEYSYEGDVKTGQSYVKDQSSSYNGFELDIGAILKINTVVLSGSATTVNFQKIGWVAGLGISF